MSGARGGGPAAIATAASLRSRQGNAQRVFRGRLWDCDMAGDLTGDDIGIDGARAAHVACFDDGAHRHEQRERDGPKCTVADDFH